MRPTLIILALLLSLIPIGGRAGQELVADLSKHLVAITTGFSGTDVLLFGATDGPGDVIMVLRGPPQEQVVRLKTRTAGIWINTEYAIFSGVPAFYQTAANRPLETFAPTNILERNQIGTEHLRYDLTESNANGRNQSAFRHALIRLKKGLGLYSNEVARISTLGNRLFRADIHFPANVPVGTYQVEVYLVRGGQVVSAEITPLHVSKVGVGAEIFQLAYDNGAIYGIIAILIAVGAGWLAGVAFRKS